MSNNQIVIQLKSGQAVEGLLERPFGERNMDVGISLEKTRQRLSFALDEVCYIRFAKPPTDLKLDDPAAWVRRVVGGPALGAGA